MLSDFPFVLNYLILPSYVCMLKIMSAYIVMEECVYDGHVSSVYMLSLHPHVMLHQPTHPSPLFPRHARSLFVFTLYNPRFVIIRRPNNDSLYHAPRFIMCRSLSCSVYSSVCSSSWVTFCYVICRGFEINKYDMKSQTINIRINFALVN